MKNFKAIFLSTIFVFGLMSMTAVSEMSNTNVETILKPVDCATVYTVCDAGFPDDYGNFIQCMEGNGCA